MLEETSICTQHVGKEEVEPKIKDLLFHKKYI